MNDQPASFDAVSTDTITEAPRWGGLLLLWMAAVVGLNGVLWVTGVPEFRLIEAVEQGAAKAEEQSRGEGTEDSIRKQIQLQRDTLPFWTTIRALADFLVAPLALAFRALIVAVAFSATAALTGRPVRHAEMMAECVLWQGVWVVGLAVQVVLMLLLWRPSIESSVVMFLPAEVYSAPQWVVLHQIDLFALLGWLGMAWSAYRQRQANLYAAVCICTVLAALEIVVWASGSLLVNLSMRLTVMPQ